MLQGPGDAVDPMCGRYRTKWSKHAKVYYLIDQVLAHGFYSKPLQNSFLFVEAVRACGRISVQKRL